MATTKKAESSLSASAGTSVAASSKTKEKTPEPLVAGVSEALKFPTTADLNPAYVVPDE